MAALKKIQTCLWFDTQAEDAAKFYVSVFPSSEIGGMNHYGKEGFDIHKRPEGMVMAVYFKLQGHPFVAINGGPQFKFDEAISFQIMCDTQQDIDYFWSKLTADGGKEGPCGWLKDKFGLSWQVVPTALDRMMLDRDEAKRGRVTKAFLQMKKFDIEALERAFEGR